MSARPTEAELLTEARQNADRGGVILQAIIEEADPAKIMQLARQLQDLLLGESLPNSFGAMSACCEWMFRNSGDDFRPGLAAFGCAVEQLHETQKSLYGGVTCREVPQAGRSTSGARMRKRTAQSH